MTPAEVYAEGLLYELHFDGLALDVDVATLLDMLACAGLKLEMDIEMESADALFEHLDDRQAGSPT